MQEMSKHCVMENLNLGRISQVLGLGFSIPNYLSWVLDLESQDLGHGSLVVVSGSSILVPRSLVSGLGSQSIQKLLKRVTKIYYKIWQVLQNVTSIIKCDRKFLHSVTSVTKCDRKLLQSVAGITKYNRKLLQGET